MTDNKKELNDVLYALIGVAVVSVVLLLFVLLIRHPVKHQRTVQIEQRERVIQPRLSHQADSIAICQEILDLAEPKSFDLENEDGKIIITYPSVFTGAGKYGHYAWGDIKLNAWIVANKSRKTADKLVSQYRDLSYKMIKENYYVVSWAHDGVIVYEKTLLSGGSLFVVQLVYPENYKDLMDAQVRRISKIKMQ